MRFCPRTEDMDTRCRNPDDDPRGPWKPSGLDEELLRPGNLSIACPSGKIIAGPPSGSYWRVSEEKFWQMDRDNRIWWGNDGNGVPAIKRFLSEVKQGRVPQTLWRYDEVGHTQEAKKELLQLIGQITDNVLDTLKPIRLICRMIELATDHETEDIVLDFFSGSASTARGLIEQNRKTAEIGVSWWCSSPEALPKPEPRLKTIADIGKERLRNAISQMQRTQADQLPSGHRISA